MENIKLTLNALRPELPITMIELPDGENLNTMWLNYGADGILQLINDSKSNSQNSSLEIINDFKIGFKGKTGMFYVIGTLPMDFGNLRIALHIIERENQKKHRLKIDLADFVNVQNQCRELNEKQGLDANLLEVDLLKLADLLDDYREQKFDEEFNPITDLYSEKELNITNTKIE